LTPAEFTASLNAVNAYFDGALFLAPAWTVNPGSGGVLDCQVRNNKTVPGKNALRIALNFSMWGPKVPQLMVRALPLTALARRPSHEAVFESDDQILPWSEHDMILATAGLCAAFGWTPVGGNGLGVVEQLAADICTALKTNKKTCRHPIAVRRTSPSLVATPMEALWESCQGRLPEELE